MSAPFARVLASLAAAGLAGCAGSAPVPAPGWTLVERFADGTTTRRTGLDQRRCEDLAVGLPAPPGAPGLHGAGSAACLRTTENGAAG